MNYMDEAELREVASLLKAINDLRTSSISVEDLKVFDSNGDLLGIIQENDSGDYAFFPKGGM